MQWEFSVAAHVNRVLHCDPSPPSKALFRVPHIGPDPATAPQDHGMVICGIPIALSTPGRPKLVVDISRRSDRRSVVARRRSSFVPVLRDVRRSVSRSIFSHVQAFRL